MSIAEANAVSRTRKVLFSVATILVAILVACAFVEASLRLAGIQPDVPRMEPNQFFGWRHIPDNTWWYDRRVPVHSNSRGLRDRDFAYGRSPGTSRVLVLGDSMTEGAQVRDSETFPKRLEQSLTAAGRPVEVINAGVGGFGTAHEVLFYEREGARYQPDIVVLAFFMGNDVYDNSEALVPTGTPGKPQAPYFVLTAGELRLENFPCHCEAPAPQGASARLRTVLRRHSALYRLIGPFVLAVAPNAAGWLAQRGAMGNRWQQTSWMMRDDIPLYLLSFAKTQSLEWSEAWEITRQLIRRADVEVTRTGAMLIVAGIPAREQVHEASWEAALATYPKMRARQWDLDLPDRMLADATAAAGVNYVSLLQPLREHANRTGQLLFFDDADELHLNAQGHAVIATVLQERLTALMPVDGRQAGLRNRQ